MDQPSSLRIRQLVGQATIELNVDDFIKDISESGPIWNRPGAKTEAHWNVIALKHDLSVDFLKKKWTNLRKSFRNELRKIPRNENNEYLQDPRLFPSHWPYYRSMLFLVDRIHLQPISQIPVKATFGSAASSSSNSIRIAGNKRRNIDFVDGGNDDDEYETFNTTPFISAKKSRYEYYVNDEKQMQNADDMESDNEEVLEKATENLPKNNSVVEEIEVTPDVFEIPSFEQRSDYFFLMSLHQFMEKINPLRKLYVRMLMQTILHQEMNTT